MDILYADHPLFLGDTTPKNPGTLTSVTGGYIVVLPTGESLSVQPDGTFQTRPAGTSGSYEVCQPDSALNVLRFSPQGIAYPIPYRGR